MPLAVIGTDPTVGLSRDRGTGTYRVPSLLAVGDRPLVKVRSFIRPAGAAG